MRSILKNLFALSTLSFKAKEGDDDFKLLAPNLDAIEKHFKDGVPSEIKSALKGIKSVYGDTKAELRRVVTESVTRKGTIRELKDTLGTKDQEIETLKNGAPDLEAIKTENTQLKDFKQGIFKKRKSEIGSFLSTVNEKVEDENRRNTILGRLVNIPKADKEGKFNFDKMEDADVEKNLTVIDDLVELGVVDLSSNGKKKPGEEENHYSLRKPAPNTEDDKKLKSPEDMIARMREKLPQ